MTWWPFTSFNLTHQGLLYEETKWRCCIRSHGMRLRRSLDWRWPGRLARSSTQRSRPSRPSPWSWDWQKWSEETWKTTGGLVASDLEKGSFLNKSFKKNVPTCQVRAAPPPTRNTAKTHHKCKIAVCTILNPVARPRLLQAPSIPSRLSESNMSDDMSIETPNKCQKLSQRKVKLNCRRKKYIGRNATVGIPRSEVILKFVINVERCREWCWHVMAMPGENHNGAQLTCPLQWQVYN